MSDSPDDTEPGGEGVDGLHRDKLGEAACRLVAMIGEALGSTSRTIRLCVLIVVTIGAWQLLK